MEFLDAAEAVLRAAERPMRSDEITRIALEKGYLAKTGRTPEASMRAGFIMHIRNMVDGTAERKTHHPSMRHQGCA